MVVVTGCQGHLRLLVYNDSGTEVEVFSDGKTYRIANRDTARIPSPVDTTVSVSWAHMMTTYTIPFHPRPHTMNDYMNGGKLVLHVQIMADRSLVILPDDAPLPTDATNLPASVIRISGGMK